MDGCTTYRLSYWPHCGEKPPEPYSHKETENLLNAGCCFDDNTTYRLSYFGCGGDKPPDPIRQPGNVIFSPCPLSHDTVNRVSKCWIIPSRWIRLEDDTLIRVDSYTVECIMRRLRDNFLKLPNNRCVASQIDSIVLLSSHNAIVANWNNNDYSLKDRGRRPASSFQHRKPRSRRETIAINRRNFYSLNYTSFFLIIHFSFNQHFF